MIAQKSAVQNKNLLKPEFKFNLLKNWKIAW
jgi:hypothetical protein